MNELVRPATAHDWRACAELQTTARADLVEQRGGPAWLGDHQAFDDAAFERFISDGRAAVALIDDSIVGFALTAVDVAGRRASVEWLYVESDAREVGLGEMLLADAIAWSRAAGADTIESVALPGDRQTKNMFERFGMKARLLVVSLPLSLDTAPPAAVAVDAGDARAHDVAP